MRQNFAFVNGSPAVADWLTSQAGRRTFLSGGAMREVEHRSRIDDLLADARADLDRNVLE